MNRVFLRVFSSNKQPVEIFMSQTSDFRNSAGLGVSPVGAVVQAVVESLAEDGVLVVDAPGGLQHRVQQAVSGCAVPQGVEATVQSCPQLQRPVDNRRFLFQFYTQIKCVRV